MKMREAEVYLLECPEIMVTFDENQARVVAAYHFVPIKQIFARTASVKTINRCSAVMTLRKSLRLAASRLSILTVGLRTWPPTFISALILVEKLEAHMLCSYTHSWYDGTEPLPLHWGRECAEDVHHGAGNLK